MKSKETTVKLKSFASIDVGYPLRKGRTSHEENGCTYTLYPSEANETYYCDAPVPERYLTRENDLILSVAKLNDIALIEKDQTGMLVSDRYLIIRCTESKAFPAYVCMEMLSDDGRAKRRRLCRDAVLPNQKAKRYMEWECKLPSLDEQKIQCEIQWAFEKSIREVAEKWKQKQTIKDGEIRPFDVQYLRKRILGDASTDCDGRCKLSLEDNGE